MTDATMTRLDDAPCSCGNCVWKGPQSACVYPSDLFGRVDAGGTMPAGECPACGALAYVEETQDDRLRALRLLLSEGLTSGEARNVFAEKDQAPFADVIAKAREGCDDQLEIDDMPEVSEGEGGCWVAAWVWVAVADEEEQLCHYYRCKDCDRTWYDVGDREAMDCGGCGAETTSHESVEV